MRILISEKTASYGYHAGDMAKKTETLRQKNFTHSGTGHFGTGYYFYGNLKDAQEHASGFGVQNDYTDRRPIMILDLSKYKMYRGDVELLYETLKSINEVLFKTKPAIFKNKEFLNTFMAIKEALGDVGLHYENRELYFILLGYVEDINNKKDGTQLANRLLVPKGFEGIDARGTSLDNFGVGSLVFDKKPGTYREYKKEKVFA